MFSSCSPVFPNFPPRRCSLGYTPKFHKAFSHIHLFSKCWSQKHVRSLGEKEDPPTPQNQGFDFTKRFASNLLDSLWLLNFQGLKWARILAILRQLVIGHKTWCLVGELASPETPPRSTHRLCTQRPGQQPALSKGTESNQDCHLWLPDTIRQSIRYITSTPHASCFWVPLLWCSHSAEPCSLLQQLSWDPAAWHSRHRYLASKCTLSIFVSWRLEQSLPLSRSSASICRMKKWRARILK